MEFFGSYDPFDYYNAAPYSIPYYLRQPTPTRSSRSSNGIFAGAEPAATAKAARRKDTKTSFSIPVHGPDSDPEQERKAAPVMSTEHAAVRMQAAARGLLARKSVRAVCEVEREAEKMASKAEVSLLVADPRARVAVGEALMKMLLRLDAVRGARDYRRRIIKRVLALQDAVDALETKPAPAIEMAEESAVASEIPDERGSEMAAVHTPTQMEFDGAVAAVAEPEAEAGEEQEAGELKEAMPGDTNVDVDEPEDSDAEGEWEMVTDESKHAALVAATFDDEEPPRKQPAYPFETTGTARDEEPPRKEPAYPFETTGTASAGAASDGVDVTKVMQMVVALCEQNAHQGAMIDALAERVDALERTVRRMEDAESRPRRAKKLSTEVK